MSYTIYRPAEGDKVTFVGYNKAQVNWGSNDTPDMLVINETYTISSVEVHRSHTKVTIEGVDSSLKFNSVHFTPSN